MSDRGFLLLFSVFMILASGGTVGYLFASGQADTVDGLFLVLTAALVALCFLLYAVFMIRREMEAPAKPAAAKAAAAPAKASAPVTQS
jgi:hypothetical protein